MEAPPQSNSNSVQAHGDIEDMHSRETMSNSDSKSYDTIFSGQNHHLTSSTPCNTTPSHSRPPTPSPCQPTIRESDLYGIGYMVEPSNPRSTKAILPSYGEQGQHIPVNRIINLHTIDSSPYEPVPLGALHSDKANISNPYQESPAFLPKKTSSFTSQNSGLIHVGRKILKSPSPGAFDNDEGVSSLDDPEDEDLDLEKSANEALSQWFGINLNRLARPCRIIYAFENVRKHCADILKDEGHYLPDDQDEQREYEYQDVQNDQTEPCNGGGKSQAASSSQPPVEKSSFSEPGGKKRPSEKTLESGSASAPRTRARGPYKKRRVEGEFSCPYRKRNALRFNVRNHEMCANKSYQTMSILKKHLTACHLKTPTSLTCTRCQQRFETACDRTAHLEECPHPPQPRKDKQQADPEDGFDETVERRLKSRQNDDKVEEWEKLYELLFPSDKFVPDPCFVPVIEDHEIRHTFECRREALYNEIDDQIASQLNALPANPSLLAEKIKSLIEQNMTAILKPAGLIHQYLQTPQSHPSSYLQQPQPPGSDHSNDMMEGNEIDCGSVQFHSLSGEFSTPLYISTDKGDNAGGSPYCLQSSGTIGFSLPSAEAQELATLDKYLGGTNEFSHPLSGPQLNQGYLRIADVYGGDINSTTTANFWQQSSQNFGQAYWSTTPVPSNMHTSTTTNLGTVHAYAPVFNREDLLATNGPTDDPTNTWPGVI